MLRVIYVIILVVLISDVKSQFYDFFSAFQPLHSTLRPFQFDITTKKSRTDQRTSNKHSPARTAESTRTSYPFKVDELERDGDKQKHKQNSQIIFGDSVTTVKPLKKPTTHSSHNNTNTRETSQKTQKDRVVSLSKAAKRLPAIDTSRTANSRSHNEALEAARGKTNERLTFDDGKRNTIVNYDTLQGYTTKSYQDYEAKKYPNSYHHTEYPFTIRPGVKPAVVNGPPITNKPPTQRPSFGPNTQDDTTVSPELIIGPNEDYMSTVEKKRYIELAEKMCDKYKSLDITQIQAIPLVPSPEVVRVNVSSCTPNTVPLVVGGKVVTVKEFPHMTLLGWPKLRFGGYSWKCGGSLVSSRYVLTAAHCVYQDRDNDVVPGAPRAVQLGSSFLDDPKAVIIKVAAVIRHPKYKLPKSYYDLAIVKMTSTVTFSNVIRPACLGIPPSPGNPIIASGWGRTEFGGHQSHELRSVSVPIWEMSECYNALGTSRKIPDGPSSDSQLCAGEKKGGKDTCQGDSGGPAQIQDGCVWRVVAVTSLGRSCGAAHTPALYALVQRAFVSAVVFGDQIKNKPQTTNNNQQNNNNNQQTNNNNQWNNKQWDSEQQTNTERSRNQQNTGQLSNNRRIENNGDEYQSNNGRNQQSDGHQQNSNGQYNNNRGTTLRTDYNRRENYYNDYGNERIPDYQADGNPYYNGGRVWWT